MLQFTDGLTKNIVFEPIGGLGRSKKFHLRTKNFFFFFFFERRKGISTVSEIVTCDGINFVCFIMISVPSA